MVRGVDDLDGRVLERLSLHFRQTQKLLVVPGWLARVAQPLFLLLLLLIPGCSLRRCPSHRMRTFLVAPFLLEVVVSVFERVLGRLVGYAAHNIIIQI